MSFSPTIHIQTLIQILWSHDCNCPLYKDPSSVICWQFAGSAYTAIALTRTWFVRYGVLIKRDVTGITVAPTRTYSASLDWIYWSGLFFFLITTLLLTRQCYIIVMPIYSTSAHYVSSMVLYKPEKVASLWCTSEGH